MSCIDSTQLIINLSAIAGNIAEIKKFVDKKTKILVPVKSNAYGHGLVEVARFLQELGIDMLGISSLDEADQLRRAQVNIPLLLLGSFLPSQAADIIGLQVTPTISFFEQVSVLSKKAVRYQTQIPVHIKVDTGMGRLGIAFEHSFDFIEQVAQLPGIFVEGIFTHFPNAEADKDFTRMQIQQINKLYTHLHKAEIKIPFIHAANSLGLLEYPESHFNLVRPGVIVYGLSPSVSYKPAIPLKPALQLHSRVCFQKRLQAGSTVSYGCTYILKKDATIITIPVGYGHGYSRSLSNTGYVLCAGRYFKIAGLVCMDLTMVDTGTVDVAIGEEVVLIGSQSENSISAEDIARWINTIPYEVVCSLGNHLSRIYI